MGEKAMGRPGGDETQRIVDVFPAANRDLSTTVLYSVLKFLRLLHNGRFDFLDQKSESTANRQRRTRTHTHTRSLVKRKRNLNRDDVFLLHRKETGGIVRESERVGKCGETQGPERVLEAQVGETDEKGHRVHDG